MGDVMRRVRLTTLAISLAVLGVLAAGAQARTVQPAEPTVSCDQIVLRARSGAEDGFRVPLIVRVGGLSTTVRVGVGRACG